MKQNITRSFAMIFLVIALLAVTYIFINNHNQKTSVPVPVTSTTDETKTVTKTTVVSKSPKGTAVAVKFTRCETMNKNLCFGSGAKSVGTISGREVWDMISTSNKLYFGIESSSKDGWPYIMEVDFKGQVYDMSEYDYYKKNSVTLLSQSI